MKQSLVTRKNRKLRKLRAALPRGAGQALLRARLRADRRPVRARARPPDRRRILDDRIGEVYLDAAEIAARVRELGAEIARDYAGREPVLVGSLKACVPFVVDLSRGDPDPRTPSTSSSWPATARPRWAATSGSASSRTSTWRSRGRDVVIVDEVVDTGLTLNYLYRALALRSPESLAARGALRPALPAARRRPADPLRRLHRPGRVLRRATASTSTSAGATCPTCTWSAVARKSLATAKLQV